LSRRLEDLLPEVRLLAERLMVEAAQAGFPIVVCQTLRTFEEQEAIYQQGRSRPGPIVTHARGWQSWHVYSRAFDVCFRAGDHGITWNGPWGKLGLLGERLGLEWGGRDKAQDQPHFDYHPDLTLAQAREAASFPVIV